MTGTRPDRCRAGRIPRRAGHGSRGCQPGSGCPSCLRGCLTFAACDRRTASLRGYGWPVALLRVQEGDHGQDPPVIVGRGWQAQRGEDVLDVFLDGVLGDEQPFRDRLVGPSLGHQPEYLPLPVGELLERIAVPPGPADQLAHHRRIQHRTALAYLTHAGGEPGQVRHPLLEQVADALGASGQQLECIPGVHVLRQDQDADPRVTLPDYHRRLQALVGVRGRHPDVDDRDVRVVAVHLFQQFGAVGGQPGDLEACLLEQPGQALAQDDGVVGDYYSHGNSARKMVPRPRGLVTVSVPPSASTRSVSPRSPVPPPTVAPPIPSSATSTMSTAPARAAVTRASLACECLAAFVSASLTTK